MADLARVKKNDTLMIPVNVIEIDGTDIPVRVEYHSLQFWLDPKDLEAAEHIPAPRIFKRGDWVKLNFSDPQSVRQNGIVLRLEQRTTVSLGSRVEVEVSWPDGQIHWYVPNDLEPDEAPE